MCLLCIFLCFTIQYALSDRKDCIAGEIWYELCQKCKCQDNGIPVCESHLQSCYLGKCNIGIIIFNSRTRCHCSGNGWTVCVPLSYQPDLDGKPCSGESYYYDNCTFCQCDPSSNTTRCTSNRHCDFSRGGICNDEDPVMENCYRCACTYSKFRICRAVKECFAKKEKPGKCRSLEDYYPPHIKDFCVYVRNQECYSDYACPGNKKCCQIVDCFLRCVDPVY